MKIGTWRPATCRCTIEEVYDGDAIGDGQHPDSQIVGHGEIVETCDAHAGITDATTLYATMMKEGQQLCGVLRTLQGHEGIDLGLHEDKYNPDGTFAGQDLKAGLEYVWSFEGTGENRKFVYEVQGATLTKEQQDLLDATVEAKFDVVKEV